MNNIQQLIQYDKDAFLAINGSDSVFWDGFMWVYTNTLIWIPLAIVLLYVIYKNNRQRETILILFMVALVILLCDRISSGLFKPMFKRFRPAQDPEMMYLVDIINNYRGGRYGFVSSHAANTFGILAFTSLLFRKKEYTIAFLIWALISCYSRIYLGVHYLGDIICGAILGLIIGCLIYLVYRYIQKKYLPPVRKTLAHQYTSTGYLVSDINLLLIALFSTIFVIMIVGMFIYEFNYL